MRSHSLKTLPLEFNKHFLAGFWRISNFPGFEHRPSNLPDAPLKALRPALSVAGSPGHFMGNAKGQHRNADTETPDACQQN